MSHSTRLLAITRESINYTDKPVRNDLLENEREALNYLYNPPLPVISSPEARQVLETAASLLHSGQVVAIPTETVYGLAADASNKLAVRMIFEAKQRPSDNPLIIHVSSLVMLSRYCRLPRKYLPLIARFWPGPLTIILPISSEDTVENFSSERNGDNADGSRWSELAPEVRGCEDNQTFAFRMPANPIARALIQLSDLPLAAPSANLSGRPSPTTAAHVWADLRDRVPLIIDDYGQSADEGLESTVINAINDPPVILRPGSVTVEQIRSVQGFEGTLVSTGADYKNKPLETPGMKYRHYCPTKAKVVAVYGSLGAALEDIRNITVVDNNLPVLKFGLLRVTSADCLPFSDSPGERELSLASLLVSGNELTARDIILHDICMTNVHQLARRLFSAFREMDAAGVQVIYVKAVEESNEGLALMNRLRKASSRSIY